MAATWSWKLVSVSGSAPGTDDAGNPITIDLTKQGRFTASVDVFDATGTKVDTRSYDFPYSVDNASAQTQISADVARLRDARARVASLTPIIGVAVQVA